MNGRGERSGPTLVSLLREAIASGGLAVVYQPVVRIRTGQVVYLEALARWSSAEAGTIAPRTFIDLAERAGLIDDITELVVGAACRAIVSWPESRLPVSVNVPTSTLVSPHAAERLLGAVRAWGVDPHRFGVEITESALMAAPAVAAGTIGELRAAGVRVDVDDFGTGYSSLGRLAQLAIDGVKIDREFVAAMTTDHRREAIVRATIALAHDLGFEAIAEGVETKDSWDLLAALGCDSVQGYHVARPMAADAVPDWLASWDAGLRFISRSGIGGDVVPVPNGEHPTPNATRASILVVDDEPAIAEVIRDVLQAEGFSVVTAANGEEALRALDRMRPRFVLLDMNMPVLDGRGFATAVRARGVDVPLVVMTAGSSAERWATELHADGFLSKPFELTNLLAVAERFASGETRSN